MQGITPEFLEELKYKCDIVEVISQYVSLQKKGGKYFGSCPFHNEKTASFCVNQSEGYYHCFGCGASGDVIKFVSEQESLSFLDSVKLLAGRVGLPLPEIRLDPHYEEKKERSETLKQLMRDAARFYRNNLLDEQKGKEAREYLLSRGIDDEVSKRYGLGVSLDYDGLVGYLRRKGYKLDELRDAGMIADVSNPSDAFGNRVIVPIFNGMNEVVAFGGRVFHGEGKEIAKYKNSTNTTLFDKGRTVYGASKVKEDRRAGKQYDKLILVEGYMDVIALGANGVQNAVACMGTALTEWQARELKRLTTGLFVCYDGDGAGKKATLHNVDILLKAGLDVLVVSLDDGKDPDETVRQDGVEAFEKKLQEAVPVTQYKLDRAESECDMSTLDGRSKYVSRAIGVLRTTDVSEQAAYLPYVAERLKGKWNMAALEKKLEEATRMPKEAQTEEARELDPKATRAERIVLFSLLKNLDFADKSYLDPEWFGEGSRKEIATCIKFNAQNVNVGSVMSYVDDSEEISKILAVEKDEFKSGDAKLSYDASIMYLANNSLSKRIDELKKRAGSLGGEEFREAARELSELIAKLKSKNLSDKL